MTGLTAGGFLSLTAFQAEGCGGGFAADYKKAGPHPPVISTVAERSGEISLINSPGSIEAGDLSTQSIMGAFSICHIPTCSPARDDGGGRAAYSHFRRGRTPFPSFRPQRSGVEKSPPLMVRAALRREIFRLRVSWERFPSVTYQHAAPLEMTVAASPRWKALRP